MWLNQIDKFDEQKKASGMRNIGTFACATNARGISYKRTSQNFLPIIKKML